MTCLKIFLQEMLEDKKNEYEMFRQFHTGLTGPKNKNIIIPTDEEFRMLCNKQIEDSRLDFARDIFAIGCSTGLRFSDAIRLTKDNRRVIGKNEYIMTNIEKTEQEQVMIPLNEVSKFFLSKHPDGIKKISNQKLNKALHDLFVFLEFNTIETTLAKYGKEIVATKEPKHKLMSMHSSRRFFISKCVNDGQISLGNVMDWSAHSGKSIFDYVQRGFDGETQMKKLYSGILIKSSVTKKKPVKNAT
jgi:integrase